MRKDIELEIFRAGNIETQRQLHEAGQAVKNAKKDHDEDVRLFKIKLGNEGVKYADLERKLQGAETRSDYYQSLAQSARVTANYWRDLYAEGCQKLKEANDKLEVFEALSKRSLCSRFLELCFPIFFKR